MLASREVPPIHGEQPASVAATRLPAWQRRGLALLLPLLCFSTAAALPAMVDVQRMLTREAGFRWYEALHAGVFGVALTSLAVIPLGLLFGLVLVVLTRQRDLALSQHLLFGEVWQRIRSSYRRPESTATAYAVILGVALLLASTYKLTEMFFISFKNRDLAALLLACLIPALLAAIFVVALTARVGLVRLTRAIGRVPVLKVLAWLPGALGLAVLAVAGVVVYLLVRYKPIVDIIDWRPLSYPALALAGGVVLLGLVLHFRGRRLQEGRAAGRPRRVLLGAWCAVLLALWTYCFLCFGGQAALRVTLLRRGYGAARSMDILSWALDWDRDGYLSFFGGGDCAPFNRAVHPGASEIPDNGVDDNCFGGDLSLQRLKTPPRRFDAKLPPQLMRTKLNVVLISFDGLRADHVGAYGYKRPATPNIDALAQRSVVFERAYAQAPSTRYSIPSFLASKYSSQVPRKSTLDLPKPILPEALLAAEIFKKAGYRTGAALSYQVFHPSWQLDQGFDFYDNSQASYYMGKGSPGWDKDRPYVLVDVAKRFLAEEQQKPFLLWVHFFEPHPPNVHRTKPRDFGRDMVGQYDGELAFADEKLGDLLEAIRRHPAAARTVIVFFADHGKGLGEHGRATHGWDLYNENLHVPLMFEVPFVAPRRIKNPVALLDMLPTLVNLCRIRNKFDFEGETLVPQLVRGSEPPPDRPIFAEVQVGFHDSHVINAVNTRDYKLIYDVTFNTYQLFDMRRDPNETTNLAEKLPRELARMKGLLYKVMERATLPTMQEEIQSSLIAAAPLTPGVRQVTFANEIQFLGFEVNPDRPRAGDITTITYYLKALARPKKDYKFLVHLKGSRGGFFDGKHVPVRGQYPTTKWNPGQVIRDQQYLRLPPGPQEYEVWVGFGLGHNILKPVEPYQMVNTVVYVGKFTAH